MRVAPRSTSSKLPGRAAARTRSSRVQNIRSDADLEALAKQADEITAISVSRGAITSAGAKRLKEFKALSLLFFHSSFADDAVLEALSDHPTLQHLTLNDARIGDSGLIQVAKMPRLRTLHLSQAAVTSSGFAALAKAPALQELTLMGTSSDNETLAELKKLKFLRNLSIHGGRTTDDGLKHLADYPALESFVISTTPIHESPAGISDKGLEYIAKTKISRLFIARAAITDAGLKHLEGMTTLRNLTLNDTEVTSEGLDELKTKLPALRVMEPHSSGIPRSPAKR